MPFVFLAIIVLLLLGIILLFSSKRLSPVPYFPTNKQDLPLIMKSLELQNNQTVYDIGAGDGIVIFKAAKLAFQKNINTQFVAIDINPVLVCIMHFKRLFHPNKKNITIICSDLFKLRLSDLKTFKPSDSQTVYLYVSPWMIERIVSHATFNLRGSTRAFVTYYYPIPSLKHKQTERKGVHSVFCYHEV